MFKTSTNLFLLLSRPNIANANACLGLCGTISVSYICQKRCENHVMVVNGQSTLSVMTKVLAEVYIVQSEVYIVQSDIKTIDITACLGVHPRYHLASNIRKG